jgi:hypothetical protein
MITAIQNQSLILEDLLNSKSTLPTPLQETIKRECGPLILVDDMLQLKNYRPHLKQMALNLLRMDSDVNIKIEPSNYQKSINFIERMLKEARKSSSRYALELSTSLNRLLDEFILSHFNPESSHAFITFVRNFQRFTRYFLELQLNRL